MVKDPIRRNLAKSRSQARPEQLTVYLAFGDCSGLSVPLAANHRRGDSRFRLLFFDIRAASNKRHHLSDDISFRRGLRQTVNGGDFRRCQVRVACRHRFFLDLATVPLSPKLSQDWISPQLFDGPALDVPDRSFGERPNRSTPGKQIHPTAKEKDPSVPFPVLLASPPLRPAGEPFLDHVQGVSPSWPRLCLDQDVLAEACLDQAAQFDLV